LLGLLALLLSFTFAMSADRHNTGRQLVVNDANVLGGLYLQSSLRGLPARIAVTLLLCGTIYVTLDLNKPHQGLIHVSQSPMLHLKRTLDRDPETKP
jgi:hypothetical protein